MLETELAALPWVLAGTALGLAVIGAIVLAVIGAIVVLWPAENDDYNCSNLKWCDTLVLSKPESRSDKNISYGSYFSVTVYGSNKRPYANCISIASNSALNKFEYLCMVGSD